jgi:hypothetical protein
VVTGRACTIWSRSLRRPAERVLDRVRLAVQPSGERGQRVGPPEVPGRTREREPRSRLAAGHQRLAQTLDHGPRHGAQVAGQGADGEEHAREIGVDHGLDHHREVARRGSRRRAVA